MCHPVLSYFEAKMAGRNFRKSPLWDACSRRGAFFGLGGGHWEVPKFYVPGSAVPLETKVVTDTNVLDLRTRYKTKLG